MASHYYEVVDKYSTNVACSRGHSAVAELLVMSMSSVLVYIVRLYV